MADGVQLFRALADETRLRILNLLVRGELCVCDIMGTLDIGQSKASRHLATLKNAGLVTDRREGLWVHYSLAEPDGVLHRRVVEWLAEAQSTIPHAAEDLKTLHDLQERGEVCARCPSQAPREAALFATAEAADE